MVNASTSHSEHDGSHNTNYDQGIDIHSLLRAHASGIPNQCN